MQSLRVVPIVVAGLAASALLLAEQLAAAVALDADFWDSYVPYRQYTAAVLRDLLALDEADLIETGRAIDGLELRVVGRASPTADLVSARIVIDTQIGRRLQVKTLPFSLSPNDEQRPRLQRRPLSQAQSEALLALLERSAFWDAPYSPGATDGRPDCAATGYWTVEALRPGSYQLIARSSCDAPDAMVVEIRDFLLGLVGLGIAR